MLFIMVGYRMGYAWGKGWGTNAAANERRGINSPQNVNSSAVARCSRKLAGVQPSGIHHHCFDVLPVGSGFLWYGWHFRYFIAVR